MKIGLRTARRRSKPVRKGNRRRVNSKNGIRRSLRVTQSTRKLGGLGVSKFPIDTRERIVDAATRVLLKEGVEGFSMRKLAQQIGLTPTAVYFHFQDKQSLLGEVVDRQFMVFRQAFEKISRIPDPIERLRLMGDAFVDFAMRHPDHYQLLFLRKLDTIPRGKLIEKGNPRQDCYALLLATVKEAIGMGQLRDELKDPHLVAQVFFAGVHGLMALHVIKGQDDWVQWAPISRKAPVLIEALISGLTGVNSHFLSGKRPNSTRRVYKHSSQRGRV